MRARRRPQAVLVAAGAVLALPALPHGWPRTLQIGLTESPGKHAPVQLGFRYQYLAGGVDTGNGWSTWNPNGTFASMYVQDSWAHNEIPVLSYYMVLQSSPSLGGEAATDLAHLRDPQLMEKYWQDVTLLFQRVAGAKTVVVHVEPDLWGYLEQANDVALASQFAQKWIALRAGFYEKQQGNNKTWFTPADFHRHLLYSASFVKATKLRMVAWQIPLGNTFLNDTSGHYRDNRVQWLLGSRGHLRAYMNAGYIGFMFGGGADGTTSATSDGGYFFKRVRAYTPSPLKLP